MMLQVLFAKSDDSLPTGSSTTTHIALNVATIVRRKRDHSQSEPELDPDSEEAVLLSCSSSSSPSCCSNSCSTNSVAVSTTNNKKRKLGHRFSVHFCEEANEYHHATCHENANDQVNDYQPDSASSSSFSSSSSSLWFSKQELLRFRHETIAMTRRLIIAAQQSNQAQQENCVQTLEHVYQKFCSCPNEREQDDTQLALALLAPQNAFGRSTILGMEKWVLRTAGKDRLDRRHALHRMVMTKQQQHRQQYAAGSSNIAHEEQVRHACRAMSRPVRLWAHYMALLTAQYIEE